LSRPTKKQVLNSPDLFAVKFLKILDKDKHLVPFRYNKAQAHFQANRTGRDLILKARQLGFSTLIQGEMFRKTVTSTQTTITLAHDAETTQKLRRMADWFYEHCKFGDVQPLRKYANATLATYPEFDSTSTIATAGNVEAGRGDTYTELHGSEVAFWKDAEKIVAGAMQGGSPIVTLESTPNGAQGFFYDKCMEALSGGGIWKLHFYPWWWDVDYRIISDDVISYTSDEAALVAKHGLDAAQIKWRRMKVMELGRLFIQEYPEDVLSCFLTSGNSYFGDLSGVFTAAPAEYIEGHEYIAGLDFGQTDYTAMPIFDKTTKAQVDLLHINKTEWAEQRNRIKQIYDKWHLKSVLAERNSIGSVNIEALREIGVYAVPFETTNESKAGIMSNMHELLHNGWKLLDIPAQKHEFNTFVSSQLPSGAWRLAADGDGHDDIVMGCGITLWQVNNSNWWMSSGEK
jgi:hypothetical protein